MNNIPMTLKSWISGSVSRRILSAALMIGALTGIVKVTIAIKELGVAAVFGVGDAIDIYATALLIPTIVTSILSGSFYSASIPVLIQAREQQGTNAQKRLMQTLTLWYLLALLVGALLTFMFANYYLPFIASGFSDVKIEMTRKLISIMCPWIVFSGLSVLWGSFFNANEKFFLPSLVPIITPLIILTVINLTRSTPDIILVAWALLLGAFVEMCLLAVTLWQQNYRLISLDFSISPEIRQIMLQSIPLIGSAIISSGNTIVDQVVVATLPAGSVAALRYTTQFSGLFLSIAAIGIGTAVMPFYSTMIANRDWQSVRRILTQYIILIGFVTVPITIGIFSFSEPLSRLIFQRGAVTADNVQLISNILRYSALQIPFYVTNILIIRLVSALGKNNILVVWAAISLLLNALLDLLLVNWLGIGGIAFASALVQLSLFCGLYIFIQRHLKMYQSQGNK